MSSASAGGANLVGVASSGATWVAVGDTGATASSSDAWSWTAAQATANALAGVGYGGGKFVTVGNASMSAGYGGTLLWSTDGQSWTPVEIGPTGDLQAVASNGETWVAVGSAGTALTSSNAESWATSATGVAADLHGVTYGGGTYVAVGTAGYALAFAGEPGWSATVVPGAPALAAVAFGAGRFVAVGEAGVILTSGNGTDWSPASSVAPGALSGVAFGKGRFVAVGAGGTILTSPNGVDWVAESSPTTSRLRSVAFGGDRFVAVGDGGTILRSDWSNPCYDVVVPAAAITGGERLTRWQTDVDLLNPGAAEAEVEIALLRANQANPTPATVQVTVPPGETVRLVNVLGSTFSAGNAALGFRFMVGSVDVTSRFYNNASACGGTYGMYIPAATPDQALDSATVGYFHHLSYSRISSTGFRVNIGFANATEASALVEVALFGDHGQLLGTLQRTLESFGHLQLTRVHALVGSPTVTHGWATVRVMTPNARVFAYAMLIDNISGDPIFMPPQPHPERNPGS